MAAEEDTEGSEGTNPEGGGLHDQIAHWMEVLDRWIKSIDGGMGRQDDIAPAENVER